MKPVDMKLDNKFWKKVSLLPLSDRAQFAATVYSTYIY
jgi:hypothetical protein